MSSAEEETLTGLVQLTTNDAGKQKLEAQDEVAKIGAQMELLVVENDSDRLRAGGDQSGATVRARQELTVGTYNLLHPTYAEKYREREGVDARTGKSNWSLRVPALAEILRHGGLDIYLLQEVGSEGVHACEWACVCACTCMGMCAGIQPMHNLCRTYI